MLRLFALDRHHQDSPWVEAPAWAIELRVMLGLILDTLVDNQRTEHRDMALIDDDLAELTSEVATTGGIVDSAVTAFKGVGQLIDEAVAKALAAGATAAQLQSVTDASAALKLKMADLAAAIPQNAPPPQTGQTA